MNAQQMLKIVEINEVKDGNVWNEQQWLILIEEAMSVLKARGYSDTEIDEEELQSILSIVVEENLYSMVEQALEIIESREGDLDSDTRHNYSGWLVGDYYVGMTAEELAATIK